MADSCDTSHECPSPVASFISDNTVPECMPCTCISKDSVIESVSSGFPLAVRDTVKRVDYRKFKQLLQEPSLITGENLFDHLVEIIKRIIDERPGNVFDYFEQFSRDVRAHKFRLAERLSVDPYNEPYFHEIADAILQSLKLPFAKEELEYGEEIAELVVESQMTMYDTSESSIGILRRDLERNENILQLQHVWGFCGLGFQIDEIFQLSWAIQKVQLHHAVDNARFWGRVYGLRKSYYIVEATLTRSEIKNRFEAMKANTMGEMIAFLKKKVDKGSYTDTEASLIPGIAWLGFPKSELIKMRPEATGIPQLEIEEKFDMPAEPIGTGLNRKVYFVTTSLAEDWYELPIVTPKHIRASKLIKKFFTGNPEAGLACFPPFPGLEKHYLRAMIARITSGTYIAPYNYYRKLTRKERKLAAGDDEDEIIEEGEDAYESEAEEEILDNDALITENSFYEPYTNAHLAAICNWVHFRPNILNKQGRIIYVDEELAIKELEKRALEQIKRETLFEEGEEEEEEDQEEHGEVEEEKDGEEEDLYDEEDRPEPEVGPELFSFCSDDQNDEDVPQWSSRYTSMYYKSTQMVVMRSNLWPGAYSFAFKNLSDSIYIGWGQKYVSRCISLENAPEILDLDYPDTAREATDPTVEMEEKWRLYHLKKDFMITEEMSNISVEFDIDDEEDEYH